MTTTTTLYAAAAAGTGLDGRASAWTGAANAAGPPNGVWAANNDPTLGGRQQLTLSGYNPQDQVLAATGNVVPYAVQYVQAWVTYRIDDAASNFTDVSVLLCHADGTVFARAPLYLLNAGDGLTVTGHVTFIGHAGYGNAPLSWADLAGLQVAVQITRSGAAGPDTFRVDAVGLAVTYTTVAPTDPTQVALAGTGVTLRVYDRSGNRMGLLPWTTLTRTVVRNAAGALSATVPRGLIPDTLLEEERYLRVAVNGVEAPDWYLLDDDGDDDADAGGPMRPVTIAGTGVAEMLDWGVVYSWEYQPENADALTYALNQKQYLRDNARNTLQTAQTVLAQEQAIKDGGSPYITQYDIDHQQQWVTQAQTDLAIADADLEHAAQLRAAAVDGVLLGLDPTHPFAAQTPGFILNELLRAAQRRGCFPNLTWSFTGDVDSAGRGWPTTYSRTYDIGTSLLKVLTTMSEDGWVDWEMIGFSLDVYVPDTALAVDRADLVLRLGKGVTQAPRKRTRKTARSAILANGDQGATVQVTDPTGLARWGRREGYEGRSGVTDYGTLTAATTVSLARQTDASESLTLVMDPFAMAAESPALPRPGGFIRYDQRRLDAATFEPLRVQSIAWDYGPDTPAVSVELNDLWVDADIKRGRQLDAILNGSSANERVPQPPAADDKIPPGKVAGLAISSAAYLDSQGLMQAQVTATWTQVTQNADGSAISDLAGYRIQWQLPSFGTAQGPVTPASGIGWWNNPAPAVAAFQRTLDVAAITLTTWSPVPPGVDIEVRIQAVDRVGNTSDWSDWVVTHTGVDQTPPPPPSTPIVDNYLGLLRVAWDGKAAGGAAMPPDLSHVDVYVGDVRNFTPSPATLIGSMSVAGPLFAESTYSQTRYAKLLAVDTSGNTSTASVEVSGQAQPVVSADIFDGAVGSQKLADLAVTTAKINDLAVNNAKVGSIAAGKITAGIISAEVTISGRIATALSGTRVELNAAGIYAWQGTTQTVAIDANGALLTGTYKTAQSGRRIEIGVTAGISQIDMWGISSAATQRSFLRSYTAYDGRETLQIGVGDPLLLSAGLYGETRLSMTGTASNGLLDGRFTNYKFSYGSSFALYNAISSGGMLSFYMGAADYSAQFTVNSFLVQSTGGDVSMSWNSTGLFSVNYGSGGGGRLDISGARSTSRSPDLIFRTYGGDSNRISIIRDGGVNFWFRDANDAAWVPLVASQFAVGSDADGKRSIERFDRARGGTFTDRIRATPVSRYRRFLGAAAPHGTDVGPLEIGLIAQDAPADIVMPTRAGLTIDLYQMATVLWGSNQEQDEEIAELRQQLGALTERVATLSGGSST